ncbi:MAG TPA: FAD-dependent monooxygenase [Xanthobacteraceae bacterium]|jgi:2-polyprenyl-6-methoxyphenol hydroxylase-like FAD-dependent oxidoreductase|nr:FAD-dependent monooxygenase [Xanthobacteraceae bacterium]
MTRRRALIIGGSLGGLFAAHLLRAAGWDVEVYERIGEDLAGRGAGLGTHDALRDTMGRIGLDIVTPLGVATHAYVCRDRSGRAVHEIKLERVMSAWARLYRPLRDALPAANYHPGMALARVETDENGATAIFTDGTRISGDLLVGADGGRSTVRTQFLPDVKPEYAGYVAWRALVPETDLAPASRAALSEHLTFCIPDGELWISYPVPARDGDIRPGKRDYNIVWYRPIDEATLADINTDATGQRHEQVPPPLIRPEITAAVKADARARLAPAVADIFVRTEQPFFQAIFDLSSPRLVFGRVALLGDAAFVARPHVGAGVTKAALDATCLADATAAEPDLDAALATYDRERRRFGDWIVARSRDLGACIGLGPAQRGATRSRDLSPQYIMGEYATLPVDVKNWAAGTLQRASA